MSGTYTLRQVKDGTGFRAGTRFIEIGLPGQPELETYTALRDIPGKGSALIGVFSTEERARAACQEEQDEDDEVSGQPESRLDWHGDTADLPEGESYVVLLSTLDTRAGLG